MALRMTVPGGASGMDARECRRALEVLVDPAHSAEIAGFGFRQSRVFRGDDLDGMVQAASYFSGGEPGVYYRINPVKPLSERGRPDPKPAARVGDVVKRRWLLVDVDHAEHKRNATDLEKRAVRAAALDVKAYLGERGWPAPVEVDSGNGVHLLYRIDLPNDEECRKLVAGCLEALAGAFAWGGPTVGTECSNANRLGKLPGTTARRAPEEPGRPHRPVRLLRVPEPLEVVPREMLEALASPEPEIVPPEANGATQNGIPETSPGLKLTVPPAGPGRPDAWTRAGRYVDKCKPAVSGQEGHNTTLSVARGVVWGFALGVDEGFRLLSGRYNPRCVPPWSDADLLRKCEEVERTPDPAGRPRGYLLDQDSPEPPPEMRRAAEPAPGERITVRASSIKRARITWLWPAVIPRGKLSLFAGQTKLGKTMVAMDVVARVTKGLDWPDGAGGEPPAQALIITGDDDFDDTLVPRLEEAGADTSRVHFLTEPVQAAWTMASLSTLDRALAEIGPGVSLVVIDPPASFLGDKNESRNAEVRSLLTPFKDWAKKHMVAVLLITHINKGSGAGQVEALLRVMGSAAWVTSVRVGRAFARDPHHPDRCLFLPLGTNIGKEGKGLAYRVVESADSARIEWLGEVDTTADEAMARKPARPRAVNAAAWLVAMFREKLEWRNTEFFARQDQAGVSANARKEAHALLGLPKARKVTPPGGPSFWVWWAPPDWPYLTRDPPQDLHSGLVGRVDLNPFTDDGCNSPD